MSKLTLIPIKPFQCELLEVSAIVLQVLVNFGIVVSTNPRLESEAAPTNDPITSFPLNNIFIPKNSSSGLRLERIGSQNYVKANSVDVYAEKGCICLKIVLNNDYDDLTSDYSKRLINEWGSATSPPFPDTRFKDYLKAHVKDQFVKKYIASDIDSVNFSNPDLGLTLKVLVPPWDAIDPDKTPNYQQVKETYEKLIDEEKKILKAQGIEWTPEDSAYYVEVNPNDPYGNLKDAGAFTAQPKDYYFSTSLLPLINMSNTIKDVFIEFVKSDLETLQEEEKLDKYNFIIESTDPQSGGKIYTKLIPIAWIDMSSDNILEQIVDFDYIFNFPYYYLKLEDESKNRVTNFQFIKKEEVVE
jgi:hypothetical protein